MQTQTYSFLLEHSPTPIYQRIIENFENGLKTLGHNVISLSPFSCTNHLEYAQLVQNSGADFCFITNSEARLAAYIQARSQYLFELIDIPIIFIHHDSLFGSFSEHRNEDLRLNAFCNVNSNSVHFCLEIFNWLDLQKLGIDNLFLLPHASEFKYVDTPEKYQYDVSFVGHVLPVIPEEYDDLPDSHRLKADFWNRLACLETKLERSAINFARKFYPDISDIFGFLTAKYYYIFMLNLHSMSFRGELIKRLEHSNINIFGGDPSYLCGLSRDCRIPTQNVVYHPATSHYSKARDIYANSKINLNITSLQFDNAVINRVIDVASAGGFILTDWKSDLQEITSVHQEISYRTIDELNSKIDYYLFHEDERIEIAHQLHQDVIKKHAYDHIISFILSKLESGLFHSK
jgi:hypothetical protein